MVTTTVEAPDAARLARAIVRRSGLRPGIAFDQADLEQSAHLEILKIQTRCTRVRPNYGYAFLHFRKNGAADLKRRMKVEPLGNRVFDVLEYRADERIEELVDEYAGKLWPVHQRIVRMLAQGLPVKSIGSKLKPRIGYRSVLRHIEKIRKAALRSRGRSESPSWYGGID